jgi:hypothetical protein
MPCSQMISMNIRPPRATAERKVAIVPKRERADPKQRQAEHRVRDARSIATNATRQASAAREQRETRGLPQPVCELPYGRMP